MNRSNTAVELTVALRDLPLDAAQRDLVRSRLGTRLTRRGELRLVASAQRSQLLNRRAAERRLVELLDAALEVERPRTPTSPSRAARARRQAERKRAQARHAERRWSPGADE